MSYEAKMTTISKNVNSRIYCTVSVIIDRNIALNKHFTLE